MTWRRGERSIYDERDTINSVSKEEATAEVVRLYREGQLFGGPVVSGNHEHRDPRPARTGRISRSDRHG